MDVNDCSVSFAVDARNPEDVARALAEAFRQIQVLVAANEILTVGVTTLMASVEILVKNADPESEETEGKMRSALADLADKAWEKVGPHPLLTVMRTCALKAIPGLDKGGDRTA